MQELQGFINSQTPLGHFIYSLRELGSRFARTSSLHSKLLLKLAIKDQFLQQYHELITRRVLASIYFELESSRVLLDRQKSSSSIKKIDSNESSNRVLEYSTCP